MYSGTFAIQGLYLGRQVTAGDIIMQIRDSDEPCSSRGRPVPPSHWLTRCMAPSQAGRCHGDGTTGTSLHSYFPSQYLFAIGLSPIFRFDGVYRQIGLHHSKASLRRRPASGLRVGSESRTSKTGRGLTQLQGRIHYTQADMQASSPLYSG